MFHSKRLCARISRAFALPQSLTRLLSTCWPAFMRRWSWKIIHPPCDLSLACHARRSSQFLVRTIVSVSEAWSRTSPTVVIPTTFDC